MVKKIDVKTKVCTTQLTKILIFHTRTQFTHSLHMLAVYICVAECKSTVITWVCRCAAGNEYLCKSHLCYLGLDFDV